MKTSDTGISLLKQFEGCRLTAYQLPGEKYYTIGYGHYGPDVMPGQMITKAQAEMMLRVDLEKYEKLVEQYVTDIKLNQNRFDALVSYTYNRGSRGIKQLSQNCHTVEEYSEGFITYWGSAQKYKDALLKRRARERALFDSPVKSDEMREIKPELTADTVINIALAEEGYLEKSKAAYLANPSVLDKKTEGAGSDNYTKYGRDMHALYPSVMDFPAPWCDDFADWCFYKAFGVTNAKKLLGGDFDDYTVQSAQLYMAKKAYIYKGDGQRPRKGDQIFFHNGTRICHTGLVIDVDDKKVYTIEGNTSGANGLIANGGGVCRKQYLLNYAKIHGYGRPAYDKIEKITEEKGPHIQLNYQPAQFYYTNADLNIRRTTGSENSQNKTGHVLPAKSKVFNIATARVGNQIWMLIDPNRIKNFKEPYAWICADTGIKAYVQEKP